MYSIKATRSHVKNGANLSVSSPAVRSSSPLPVIQAVSSANDRSMMPVLGLPANNTKERTKYADESTSELKNPQMNRSGKVAVENEPINPPSSLPESHLSPLHQMKEARSHAEPSTPPQNCSPFSSSSSSSSSVRITVTTRGNNSWQQLESTVVQSPSRDRASPIDRGPEKKQVPLFYSPLLTRQLQQQQLANNRKKERNSNSFLPISARSRRTSNFDCFSSASDAILQEPPEIILDRVFYNPISCNVPNRDDLSDDSTVDLGLDPPSWKDLMTNEDRWHYQSKLAGWHMQDMTKLDLSHRVDFTPAALFFGIPRHISSILKEFKFNASLIDQQALPHLLELFGRIFPNLRSLSLILPTMRQDDGILFPYLDMDSDRTFKSRQYVKSSNMDKQIITNQKNLLVETRLQRLYILRILPSLDVINEIPVSQDERRQIVASHISSVDHHAEKLEKNRNLSNSNTKKNNRIVEQSESLTSTSAADVPCSSPASNSTNYDDRKVDTGSLIESSEEQNSMDLPFFCRSSLLPAGVRRSRSWTCPETASPQFNIRLCYSADEDFSVLANSRGMGKTWYFDRQLLPTSYGCASDSETEARIKRCEVKNESFHSESTHRDHNRDRICPRDFISICSTSNDLCSSVDLSNDEDPNLSAVSRLLEEVNLDSPPCIETKLEWEHAYSHEFDISSQISWREEAMKKKQYQSGSLSDVTENTVSFQHQMKSLEEQMKCEGKENLISEKIVPNSTVCSDELQFKVNLQSKIGNNLEKSGKRRPLTKFHHADVATMKARRKKDSSLPPTSPASILVAPKAPPRRQRQSKRRITISNMEKLRKRKSMVDQILDDDDEDETDHFEESEESTFDDALLSRAAVVNGGAL